MSRLFGLRSYHQLGQRCSYPMQHAAPVDIFQSTQRHGRPALDVGVLKDEGLVPDDRFEVGIQKLEDEVDVLLDGKDIKQLKSAGSRRHAPR